MHDLGRWWPFARTAWGWTVATVGGLAAIYYGPRKIMETLDWYKDRFFDYKIREYLELQVTKSAFVHPSGGRIQTAAAKTEDEIAQAVGYSKNRIKAGLDRLKKKKAVTREGIGWKLVVDLYTS
jgi:hypothetical protein